MDIAAFAFPICNGLMGPFSGWVNIGPAMGAAMAPLAQGGCLLWSSSRTIPSRSALISRATHMSKHLCHYGPRHGVRPGRALQPAKVKETDDKYRQAAGKPLDNVLMGRK